MRYKGARIGSSQQDLAQDRAFWHALLTERASSGGLPAHSAGGFRNRRFAIIRNAAWITLYRAKLPFPQIGVFLRCAGLAGEAFFTMADRIRTEIEPRLLAGVGSSATLEWGVCHHPGMTDIGATLGAPLPWTNLRPNSILHGCCGLAPFGGTVSRRWSTARTSKPRNRPSIRSQRTVSARRTIRRVYRMLQTKSDVSTFTESRH